MFDSLIFSTSLFRDSAFLFFTFCRYLVLPNFLFSTDLLLCCNLFSLSLFLLLGVILLYKTGPCDPSVTISLLHTKVLHCYTRRAKLLHCYTLNCYTVTQQIVTLLYYLYPFYRYISTTVILCISIPFIAISITVKRLSFFISLYPSLYLLYD